MALQVKCQRITSLLRNKTHEIYKPRDAGPGVRCEIEMGFETLACLPTAPLACNGRCPLAMLDLSFLYLLRYLPPSLSPYHLPSLYPFLSASPLPPLSPLSLSYIFPPPFPSLSLSILSPHGTHTLSGHSFNTENSELYGMMLYHRNRLIKPYLRVGIQQEANSKAS